MMLGLFLFIYDWIYFVCCYGLNIHVFPKSTCWGSNPQWDDFGDGTFRSDGIMGVWWDWYPYKGMETSVVFFCHVRIQKEDGCLKTRKRAPNRPWVSRYPNLSLLSFQSYEKQMLVVLVTHSVVFCYGSLNWVRVKKIFFGGS